MLGNGWRLGFRAVDYAAHALRANYHQIYAFLSNVQVAISWKPSRCCRLALISF